MAPLPDAQYCYLKYLLIFGRPPDLADPKRFTEKVQVRKLYDRNPLFPRLADKIESKAIIEERVGGGKSIPTLWAGTELGEVDWDAIRLPVVVKPSHASGVGSFIQTPDDVAALLAENPSRDWLAIDHSRFNREWAYRAIPPRIMIEPALLDDGDLPVDYRCYAFDGVVSHVEIDFNGGSERRYDSYTPNWEKLELRDPGANGYHGGHVEPPPYLAEMLETATRLAEGLDFVRVDFLGLPDRFYAGELTLYPGGGFDRCEPDSFDFVLGSRWRLPPVAMAAAGRD